MRNHLRLNSDRYDANLERCLNAAKALADAYCNNPFELTPGDATTVEIPYPVEMWVLRVASLYFNSPEGAVDYVSEQGVGVVRRNNDYNLFYRELRPYRIKNKMATRGGGSA